MADIAGDIQRALFARLTAYAPLSALVGQRVFDRITPNTASPYLTIFEAQLIEAGDDCTDGDEVSFDVHVWSRAVGSFEAKAIAGHVRKALHGFDLPLGDDHALIDLSFTDARFFRDPDGLTTHGVVSFRALTQTP